MIIAHITPSAGESFYCENCLRDMDIVKAMRDLGHEIGMVPMYLPLPEAEDERVSGDSGSIPIFFGGINVYLQQKFTLFRKTPRWLDRLFDMPSLLKWISRRSMMTSARDLSETTISILQGEHGRQKKELRRLLDWFNSQDKKPDIVCLSNVLLSGLAKSIKSELGVPVVCLLQDESEFVDAMEPQYAEKVWGIIRDRCNDIDVFISVSRYYETVMRQKLGLSADKIRVVYAGISVNSYKPVQSNMETPSIGYISRMCFDKGLDILVDAFSILKKKQKLKNLKLRIAGGKTGNDEAFIKHIREQLHSCGLINDVEFPMNFGFGNRQNRIAFLQNLSVLSVPERHPVAYGLYVIEALATGVPVVQPSNGVFPELLEAIGGGLMFEPNNAVSLACAIESLLGDPMHASLLAEQGRKNVLEKFDVKQTAMDMLLIYRQIV